MKLSTTLALLLSIGTLLTGCGALPEKHAPGLHSETQTQPNQLGVDSDPTTIKLYAQHKRWKGTPYKLGGLSRKGIDCSGFVYITYKVRFGRTLPRTTRMQAKTGTKITRQQLQSGDLVFFKTSLQVRHVGIYIEDGKFLHASTSKGVMISNINNHYWKAAYWKAMRL